MTFTPLFPLHPRENLPSETAHFAKTAIYDAPPE